MYEYQKLISATTKDTRDTHLVILSETLKIGLFFYFGKNNDAENLVENKRKCDAYSMCSNNASSFAYNCIREQNTSTKKHLASFRNQTVQTAKLH